MYDKNNVQKIKTASMLDDGNNNQPPELLASAVNRFILWISILIQPKKKNYYSTSTYITKQQK